MRNIQTSNVNFRCTDWLRERLTAFAEANDLHVSAVIRGACADFLRREAPIGNASSQWSERPRTEAPRAGS